MPPVLTLFILSAGISLIVGYLKVLKDQSPLALQASTKINPSDLTKPINDKKQTAKNTDEVKTEPQSKETTPTINEMPADNINNVRTGGTINFKRRKI